VAAGEEVDGATIAFIESCRRAVLATLRPDGRARLVPICFALGANDAPARPPVLYTPLDAKPKRATDLRALARVRDITVRPTVTLLFDRWSEDWSELAWVRVDGDAALLEPGGSHLAEHRDAVARLRARYAQYASHPLERAPLIRITLGPIREWRATEPR
jgi:PPOX class probable F420-dependent enzyme